MEQHNWCGRGLRWDWLDGLGREEGAGSWWAVRGPAQECNSATVTCNTVLLWYCDRQSSLSPHSGNYIIQLREIEIKYYTSLCNILLLLLTIGRITSPPDFVPGWLYIMIGFYTWSINRILSNKNLKIKTHREEKDLKDGPNVGCIFPWICTIISRPYPSLVKTSLYHQPGIQTAGLSLVWSHQTCLIWNSVKNCHCLYHYNEIGLYIISLDVYDGLDSFLCIFICTIYNVCPTTYRTIIYIWPYNGLL